FPAVPEMRCAGVAPGMPVPGLLFRSPAPNTGKRLTLLLFCGLPLPSMARGRITAKSDFVVLVY
ncbi:hypothetical protein LJC22_07600, partial [Desulfosarcina sp. OttesenSCG-928-G10]|nr:hypothetical protein [Desulfosarcina sp. OttesenSCG-928-G10]